MFDEPRISQNIIELCWATHSSRVFLAKETYPESEEGLNETICDTWNIGTQAATPEFDLKVITQALILGAKLKSMKPEDRASSALVAKAKEECGDDFAHTFFLGDLLRGKFYDLSRPPARVSLEDGEEEPDPLHVLP